MRIAIHHREGSFSDEWIKYCVQKEIHYKIVDCYSSSIIDDVNDCDIVMWHWHHKHPTDILFARQLIYALEKAGKYVFPNINTCMYFDDKVGQKYIFEALHVPLVPSYVFYDKNEALEWAQTTDYPKVFKLRGGSGALNVQLIRNLSSARKVIKRAFRAGFSQRNFWIHLKEKVWILRKDRDLSAFVGIFKTVGRLFFPSSYDKVAHREKGYVYFQKFLPNNDFDIRVIVIGDKCVAKRRFNREGDFRASGSGLIDYDPSRLDVRCIQIAFDVSRRLGAQSLAYDFIFDESGNPLIVEISYAFPPKAYEDCPGYWDSSLVWHEGKVNPQFNMIEDLIQKFKNSRINN